MEKQMLAMWVLVACMVGGQYIGQGRAESSKECRKRAEKLCGPSHLTFYLHNTLYDVGLNNSDFNSVARPPPPWPPSPVLFGTMVVFEDPLTRGASSTSKPLGVAQGSYLLDSMTDRTLFHIFTANITQGRYLGSITIMGQVREISPVRLLSVVGGTGDFLGAHGVASNTLVAFSAGPPVKWTNKYELDLYY